MFMIIYICLFNICQTKLAKLVFVCLDTNKGLQVLFSTPHSPPSIRSRSFAHFQYLCKLKVYANNLQIVLKKAFMSACLPGDCCIVIFTILFSIFFSFFHLAFFHKALAMSTYAVFMAFLIRHLRYFRLWINRAPFVISINLAYA